jgi:flagellin-like hook-associated protein FlgL
MVLTNGKAHTSNIQIDSNYILVQNLKITSKSIIDYLLPIPESGQQQAIIRALEVGSFCLERTQSSQDIDFVKLQIKSLLEEVTQIVRTVPKTVEQELISKIGTAEGQVLAPIQTNINLTSKELTTRLNEVKTLLSQEIDPSKESSVLGKALKELKNLLDAKRQDSVQSVFTAALEKATAENGTLAKSIKSVVAEAVKPLADEVDKLTKEIRGLDAAAEALQNTTVKGATYEDEVVVELQHWSKLMGLEINYVATDNKPGDVVINCTSKSVMATDLSIVIEIKDVESDGWGRKRISEHVSKAMSFRSANAAIFLCRTSDGLAREIGEWAEGTCGQGYWVATTHNLLVTAIRFLIVQQRLEVLRATQPEIDASSVEAQIQRIRTALKRVTNINTHLGSLRKSSDAIASEVDSLKLEIKDALDSMEDAIR